MSNCVLFLSVMVYKEGGMLCFHNAIFSLLVLIIFHVNTNTLFIYLFCLMFTIYSDV